MTTTDMGAVANEAATNPSADVPGSDKDDSSLRALTGEEQALYDRQIRLWGVEAQRKLASSHVLLICDLKGYLAQEIAKNIVLAGIARLVVQSHSSGTTGGEGATATETGSVDLRPGFLGATEGAAVESLRAMNPLVDISLETAAVPQLSAFRVVCAVGVTGKEEAELGDRARDAGVALLCGRDAGEVGWVFVDDGSDNCVSVRAAAVAAWGGEVRRGEFGWHVARSLLEFQAAHNGRMPGTLPSDADDIEAIYKRLFEKHRGAHLKTDIVRRAAAAACHSMPPVCSVVGGLWGREVVKVIAGREKPLDGFNFFFFNAASSKGSVEKVGKR